jgi:membrane protein implicated in regulation of membrane protease activity
MGRLFAMMGVAGVIPLAILLVIFWPFVIIWALNTVFSLGIAYTFWTWLAMRAKNQLTLNDADAMLVM